MLAAEWEKHAVSLANANEPKVYIFFYIFCFLKNIYLFIYFRMLSRF